MGEEAKRILENRNLGTFVDGGQLREYLQCEGYLRKVGVTEEEYNEGAPLEGGCMSAWQHLVWESLCAQKSQSSWEYWYMVNPCPEEEKEVK